MRALITIVLALGVVGVAAAFDLGNRAPTKPVVTYPANIPNPERPAGDTIETAFLISSLPFNDAGTTAGYNDDYDAVCPYSGSTSPEVVYKYVATMTEAVDIDLCGSAYDTKLYVYDHSLGLIACNDDFYYDATCGMYVSKLEEVPMSAGLSYYIIIDGYGGGFGDYAVEVTPHVPCELECPPGWESVHENEPALVNDYVDEWNGGCNTPPGFPFQTVGLGDGQGNVTLCGVAGWYLHYGTQYRDTDWFLLWAGAFPDGIEIMIMAERPTRIFELGPQDCASVGVIQQADTQGECDAPALMTITGYGMGDPVWFWVGPASWETPSNPFEYDYVCWISGLQPCANQPTTWSTVKALYE